MSVVRFEWISRREMSLPVQSWMRTDRTSMSFRHASVIRLPAGCGHTVISGLFGSAGGAGRSVTAHSNNTTRWKINRVRGPATSRAVRQMKYIPVEHHADTVEEGGEKLLARERVQPEQRNVDGGLLRGVVPEFPEGANHQQAVGDFLGNDVWPSLVVRDLDDHGGIRCVGQVIEIVVQESLREEFPDVALLIRRDDTRGVEVLQGGEQIGVFAVRHVVVQTGELPACDSMVVAEQDVRKNFCLDLRPPVAVRERAYQDMV